MPDDKEVELSEDDQALENMENTLKEMRGDDSYDDVDSQDDTAEITEALTSDDEESKENDEAKSEQSAEEDDPAPSGEEESPKGEEGDEGEDDITDTGTDDDAVVDDDKLAASLTEKTRERFDHFREENKRLESEFESQNQEYTVLKESTEAMNHYINDSQISPEQLSTALSVAKALNTGDMEIARAAFPRMREMMNQVAIGLGDPSADVQLPAHLQQSQDNLDITPELAQRQALYEAQQGQTRQYQQNFNQQAQYQEQQQQQANQQQEDTRAQANQAATDIQTWENGLVGSDPDFVTKRKQMLVNSEQIMKENHPSRWLGELQKEYNTISTTMTSMAEARQRDNAKNQGIRPNAGSGAGYADIAPKSFEDNISQTLNRMRGNSG